MWDIDTVGVFVFPLEFPSRFIDKGGCDESFEFERRVVVIDFFGEGVADGVPGDFEGGVKFCFANAVLKGAEEVAGLPRAPKGREKGKCRGLSMR